MDGLAKTYAEIAALRSRVVRLEGALQDLISLAEILAASSADRVHNGNDGINPARAALAVRE